MLPFSRFSTWEHILMRLDLQRSKRRLVTLSTTRWIMDAGPMRTKARVLSSQLHSSLHHQLLDLSWAVCSQDTASVPGGPIPNSVVPPLPATPSHQDEPQEAEVGAEVEPLEERPKKEKPKTPSGRVASVLREAKEEKEKAVEKRRGKIICGRVIDRMKNHAGPSGSEENAQSTTIKLGLFDAIWVATACGTFSWGRSTRAQAIAQLGKDPRLSKGTTKPSRIKSRKPTSWSATTWELDSKSHRHYVSHQINLDWWFDFQFDTSTTIVPRALAHCFFGCGTFDVGWCLCQRKFHLTDL